jgi:hypothetical protein
LPHNRSMSDKPIRGSRDHNARLKLLGGALRLLKFTARELSEHAGVKWETARAFAEDYCNRGLFARLHSVAGPAGASGRPANCYEVLPEGREEIFRRLAQIRLAVTIEGRVAAVVSSDLPLEPPAEDFTPLALLESRLEALAEGEVTDEEEKDKLLEGARISRQGAEADFRAMIARRAEASAIERFAMKLAAAKIGLEQAEAAAVAAPAVTAPAVAVPEAAAPANTMEIIPFLQGASVAIRPFLQDWTAPLPTEAVPGDSATAPQELLNAAMTLSGDEAGSVFAASVALMRSRGAWDEDWLRAALDERIGWLSASPELATTARLAVAAAMFDRAEAAEPLLGVLLRCRVATGADAEQEATRLCMLSLARLARPGGVGADRLGPAAACQYLLARKKPAADELAILAPAALMGRYPARGALLGSLAERMFDGKRMKPEFQAHLHEAALARNLTLVLEHSRFVILEEHIANLLEKESGRGLFLSLSSPEHGALVLKDGNNKNEFHVDVAPHIVNYLGSRKQRPITLKLRKTSANLLSGVLTQRTWATLEQGPPPPGAAEDQEALPTPATADQEVEPAELPSFTQELAAAAPLRLAA